MNAGAVPVPDDRDVPRIPDTKGWRVTRTDLGHFIFERPGGDRAWFVEAHRLERAELIREFQDPAFEPLRLVRWEGSAAQQAEARTRKLAAGQTRRQRARRA